MKQKLDFHKKKEGPCDVDFSAWDLQLHRLHGMKVTVHCEGGGDHNDDGDYDDNSDGDNENGDGDQC